MVRFTIPFKPLSWNKYYAGMHWTRRQVISEEWKWIVKSALIKHKITHTAFKEPVCVKICAYMRRLIDCDNICLKVIIDGLRDWKLIVDDGPEFISEIRVRVLKDEDERIEIEVVEA